MALPNIFLIYFGQNILLGPITSDKTKLAFDRLGTSYEAWSIMIGMALKYQAEINLVIDNASIDKSVDLNNFGKQYFCYDSAGAGISAT